jgi:hypothetical protein
MTLPSAPRRALDDPEGEVGVETILWRSERDGAPDSPDLPRGAARRRGGAPDHHDAALGTPLGEGPHLSGTVGDGESTVLAVLRLV